MEVMSYSLDHVIFMTKKRSDNCDNSVADLGGGGGYEGSQNVFISMQFSGKIGQIVCGTPSGLAPSPLILTTI